MTTSHFTAAVQHLGRSFRAGVTLRSALDDTAAKYGSLAWSTPGAQVSLLNETIFYVPNLPDSTTQFTFGLARCARFVRLLMDEIDRIPDAAMDETFVECAAQVCQRKRSTHHAFSYVIFEVPCDSRDTYHHNPIVRVSALFNDLGHRVWEAGLLLYAQLVDDRTELRSCFKGRRVLELGAGTGISATAYIEAGVEFALLTDYSPDTVSNMEHNIALNGAVSDSIDTMVLDAADCDKAIAVANGHRIDTIVAADVTYDDELVKCMVNAFENLVSEIRTGFLVVTNRNEVTTALLWERVRESGLTVESVACKRVTKTFDYLAGWDFLSVSLYKVKKRLGLGQR